MSQEVKDTLNQRGQVYGMFINNATVAQGLKKQIRLCPQFHDLDADMQESIEVIMSKIARATTGNPEYIDNWRDIAGYAQMIIDRLEKTIGAIDVRNKYIKVRKPRVKDDNNDTTTSTN